MSMRMKIFIILIIATASSMPRVSQGSGHKVVAVARRIHKQDDGAATVTRNVPSEPLSPNKAKQEHQLYCHDSKVLNSKVKGVDPE